MQLPTRDGADDSVRLVRVVGSRLPRPVIALDELHGREKRTALDSVRPRIERTTGARASDPARPRTAGLSGSRRRGHPAGEGGGPLGGPLALRRPSRHRRSRRSSARIRSGPPRSSSPAARRQQRPGTLGPWSRGRVSAQSPSRRIVPRTPQPRHPPVVLRNRGRFQTGRRCRWTARRTRCASAGGASFLAVHGGDGCQDGCQDCADQRHPRTKAGDWYRIPDSNR